MTQHYLATSLRRALEKTIKEARIVAEAGASDSIRRLGIAGGKSPTYLSDEEKELRRRLRAYARTLGDRLDKNSDEQEVKRLIEAAAYAHWHRMLFARFLAERGLLRHPEHNVPVTLEDCREIAQEEGANDAWVVAERYAASMLPAVFRIDDPVLSLALDAAQNQALHRLVTDLDDEIFQAEDSLGWTYQFWRAAEKDDVNKKGDKIGADEISAVTQLFTEPYMVRFLLHNTFGAWWAGKVLATNPELAKKAADEDELRAACSVHGYSFDMLRFFREAKGEERCWRPVAGTFSGWPLDAKSITMLDPCCGSGHFLTEALAILSALRQAEENLGASEAVAGVLRDNLHGLEIDGRCVQIAAFAVALTAWRIGGWQALPLPHIAWVGAPPPLPKVEFVALADGDDELERALAALHDLFAQAPLLGSLLEPTGGDLVDQVRIGRVERLLEPLLEKARSAEPGQAEGVVAARGMADGAALLSKQYTIQATNVPFLARSQQAPELRKFLDRRFEEARNDLATAMISRMQVMSATGCSIAAVAPNSWMTQTTFSETRKYFARGFSLDVVSTLGSGAFGQISGEVVNVSLFSMTRSSKPQADFFGINSQTCRSIEEKVERLRNGPFEVTNGSGSATGAPIVIGSSGTSRKLGEFASAYQGTSPGDGERLSRRFWESSQWSRDWEFFQNTPSDGVDCSGKSFVINWTQIERGFPGSAQRGRDAWGRNGLVTTKISPFPVGLFWGERFSTSSPVIIPHDPKHLLPIYNFMRSSEFPKIVQTVNSGFGIGNGYFEQLPFVPSDWEGAGDALPPEPYSDDPTQWLFHGHPSKADIGTSLHVALSRLCGYRWPAELDNDMGLSAQARDWIANTVALPEGDQDGLLAVAGVAGEKPLADRLRAYLSAAYGADWSDVLERRLVADSDEVIDKKRAKDDSLEGWLRDRAFRQHCALFHQRPFLWHIWDGLKDGFSVFVDYHRFTQANLRKLTYTMLGDWLRRARDESNDLRYEKGRELQQKLEKVLEGEAPYDIFVRWKSLAEQPLGWDPDLDDGVRMNIRPFVQAGVLREQPKGIKWTKDRGNDVPSSPWYPIFKGERTNDHHTTLEEKRAARADNPGMVATK